MAMSPAAADTDDCMNALLFIKFGGLGAFPDLFVVELCAAEVEQVLVSRLRIPEYDVKVVHAL